ncbi:hypothetical protein J6590_107567, partial [Homalodisca vitripennis]
NLRRSKYLSSTAQEGPPPAGGGSGDWAEHLLVSCLNLVLLAPYCLYCSYLLGPFNSN